MSHGITRLENGTSARVIGALLQELTPENKVVGSWNLFEHVKLPADVAGDWCHPKSVTVEMRCSTAYPVRLRSTSWTSTG